MGSDLTAVEVWAGLALSGVGLLALVRQCYRRRHTAFGVLGSILFLWPIAVWGASRLAKPDSSFAARNYPAGSELLERSIERYGPPSGQSQGRLDTRHWLAISGILVTAQIVLLGAGLQAAPSSEAALARDVTFVYPERWQPVAELDEGEFVWVYAVSPGSTDGDYMSIGAVTNDVAADWLMTEESFSADLARDAAEFGFTIVDGPVPIEAGGLPGFEGEVTGIPGPDGIVRSGRFAVLFGSEFSYRLEAVFSSSFRAEMLASWRTMLDDLELPDTAAAASPRRYDQMVLVDFETGTGPFETGTGRSGTLRHGDGVYTAEIEAGGKMWSYGSFPVPTQSVTVTADLAAVEVGDGAAGFGIGCVDNRDGGYVASIGVDGGFSLAMDISRSDDDAEVLLFDETAPVPSPGTLQQATVWCSVDAYGNAEIAFAVNGEEQFRTTHHDEGVTYFTALQLVFSARDSRESWSIEVDAVDAHSPRPGDPMGP